MDKMELLSKRLQDVAEKFAALKKVGCDEDILISYIHDKTRLSRKDIKQMLKSQEKFYGNLVGKFVAEKL